MFVWIESMKISVGEGGWDKASSAYDDEWIFFKALYVVMAQLRKSKKNLMCGVAEI